MKRKYFGDLTAKRFTRWTAMSYEGLSKYGAPQWKCVCDCGNTKIVLAQNLILEQSKSCGCYSRDRLIQSAIDGTTVVVRTHGMTNSPTHRSWACMKARCNLTHANPVKRYALSGVTVCERWQKFENFYADMGERPSNSHSIERISNSLGYTPENCRWATVLEQGGNKRNNRIVEFNGEKKHLAEWARVLNMGIATITARLNAGWTVNDAFTKPLRKAKKHLSPPEKS